MIEQFIPYYLALKLKELGYDQTSFSHLAYYNKPVGYKEYSFFINKSGFLPPCTKSTPIIAPLYQEAFDWLITKLDSNYLISQDDRFFEIRNYINNEWHLVILGSREIILKELLKIYENKFKKIK